MTKQVEQPLRGTIWTVPEIGPEARAVVVTNPRPLAGGQNDVQGIALVPFGSPLAVHTADDFKFDGDEVESGTGYFAALWNTQSLLLSSLGERVDRITSVEAFEQLLDAMAVAPGIQLPRGRLGHESESDTVVALREAELDRWWGLGLRALKMAYPAQEWEI